MNLNLTKGAFVKKSFIFSIIIASLIASSIIPFTACAIDTPTNNPSSTTSPSKIELNQAIATIKSLPNYTAYEALDASTLENTTPLYKEYRYLFAAVLTAEAIVNNFYDQTTPEDLQLLLKSLNDATIAFNLIYHSSNQNPANTNLNADNAAQVPTPRSQENQITSAKPANEAVTLANKPETASTQVEISNVTETKATENPAVAPTETHSTAPTNPESEDVEPTNFASTAAHAATASTTCIMAGAIAIKNHNRKPYQKRRRI